MKNFEQIAKLESIKCKYPRSTFEISLYDSVFKMHGQVCRMALKLGARASDIIFAVIRLFNQIQKYFSTYHGS